MNCSTFGRGEQITHDRNTEKEIWSSVGNCLIVSLFEEKKNCRIMMNVGSLMSILTVIFVLLNW